MNSSAPSAVIALAVSRPTQQIVANLFTFALVSGPTFHWTDARTPITVGSTVFTPLKIKRGQRKLSKGMSIDSTEVQILDGDSTLTNEIRSGFFNRAVYISQRVFKADPTQPWTLPTTIFIGRVNDVKDIGRTSATITVKSMVVDLDSDFPRGVIRKDCDNVLFDAACTVSRAAFFKTGAAASGCTGNKVLSGLTDADGYYDQGILKFTSGVMAGLCYMVRNYLAGVVYVAYPLLVAPAVGDTFEITPGCDKTPATCQTKFSNQFSTGNNFPGQPFVPDPTVTY